MKPGFAFLRARGFLSTYYLDDSLLIGKDFHSCLRNIKATEQIHSEAGFIINYQIFYRFLENCKTEALKNVKGDFDANVQLCSEARSEIKSWSENIIESF